VRTLSGEGWSGPGARAPGRAIWLTALAVVPLVWGYNWVVMKRALAYVGPFEFAAWRFLLGSALLFAALRATGRPLLVRPLLPIAWVGALQTAANTALALFALGLGPAGRAAVLCYSMPFWVVLLAWPVLGERPRPVQWLALGAAGPGLLLVVAASAGPTPASAALLAVASGLCWAAGTVLSKRLLARQKLDLLAFTTWQMLFGGLVLAAAALVAPGRPTAWTPYLLFALFYEAVPATAVAWLLWLALLGRIEASLASFAILATPVLGLLFGAAEMGERPSGLEMVGLALLVAALALTGPVAARQAARGQGRPP
jgi:drug/metabolite transporter (DMT)-like permease